MSVDPPWGLAAPVRRDPLPNLGVMALLIAAGCLMSGVFLGFHYAPTFEAARDSILHIQETLVLGGFLRGLHFWGGNAAVVLAFLWGLRLFWHGAYKKPRALQWVLGCGIFLVLVGFAYTGYLLRGDDRALQGIYVAKGVAESTPLVGGMAKSLLLGGEVVSSATLVRIYAVHTQVLPVALVTLIVVFLWAGRKGGPARHHADTSPDLSPAWPGAFARDLWATAFVVVILAALSVAMPPEIGQRANLAGAGGAGKPEWFLLWVNRLLEIKLLQGVPQFVVAALLPGLLVGLAVGLPFLCKGAERNPRKRPVELGVAAFILLGLGILTLQAAAKTTPQETDVHIQDKDGSKDPGGKSVAEQASEIMRKFSCRKCHKIDGKGRSTGPKLDREGFATLYTRKFFRLKVGTPVEFFPETGMFYEVDGDDSVRPTKEELDVLETFFYDGG